jgi:hypothetical protein
MFKTYKTIFMKRINFKLVTFFIALFSLFSNQVFSVDILIRKDDPNPGNQPNNIATATTLFSAKTYSSSAKSFIPVSADVVGSELIVDFSTSVGTAFVSVVDHSGNVVYQTVVDTYSTPEVVIPVDGLSSGKYSVKIAYGSTNLIGNFQL